MDYSTTTVSVLAWDIDHTPQTEETEAMLERCGYHLSQIAYMTSEEEPDMGGVTEISDILGDKC
jgi:hypothetical protein